MIGSIVSGEPLGRRQRFHSAVHAFFMAARVADVGLVEERWDHKESGFHGILRPCPMTFQLANQDTVYRVGSVQRHTVKYGFSNLAQARK